MMLAIKVNLLTYLLIFLAFSWLSLWVILLSVVLIGRITGFASTSVRLSVPYDLLIQTQKGATEPKFV